MPAYVKELFKARENVEENRACCLLRFNAEGLADYALIRLLVDNSTKRSTFFPRRLPFDIMPVIALVLENKPELI
jgi:hypothetical protein